MTVACSRSSRIAAGFPTTFERPTTTARRPSISMPERLRISTAAWAVVGRNPSYPSVMSPVFRGWIPSMSLRGSSASNTVASGISAGSGIWTMIPDTSGSSLSSASRRRSSAGETRPSSSTSRPSTPTVSARAQDLLEVDRRGRVLADDHHGEARRMAVSAPGTPRRRRGPRPGSRSRSAPLRGAAPSPAATGAASAISRLPPAARAARPGRSSRG